MKIVLGILPALALSMPAVARDATLPWKKFKLHLVT
jgi:hypothetical protein